MCQKYSNIVYCSGDEDYVEIFSLSVLISVALGVWVRFSLLQDKTSRYNVLSPSENKVPTGIIYCVAESWLYWNLDMWKLTARTVIVTMWFYIELFPPECTEVSFAQGTTAPMMSIKDHQNGPAMHLSNTVQVVLLLDAGLAQRARIIPKLNNHVHNSSNISTVNDCVWRLGSLPGSISKPGFYRYNQSFVSMRISKAWLCQLILVFHAMTARWCMTQWFIC